MDGLSTLVEGRLQPTPGVVGDRPRMRRILGSTRLHGWIRRVMRPNSPADSLLHPARADKPPMGLPLTLRAPRPKSAPCIAADTRQNGGCKLGTRRVLRRLSVSRRARRREIPPGVGLLVLSRRVRFTHPTRSRHEAGNARDRAESLRLAEERAARDGLLPYRGRRVLGGCGGKRLGLLPRRRGRSHRDHRGCPADRYGARPGS